MSPQSRPCRPCATRGIAKPATRVMNGGMGKCEECFRGQVDPLPRAPDAPPLVMHAAEPTKEKAMPKQRTDVDWLAVQNDRSDGMSVAEICKKYRVPNSQVYTKTKGAVGGGRKVTPAEEKRGSHVAAQKIRRPFKGRAAAASANGHQEFDVAAAIAGLKARREKIDRSIAALEELL